MARKLHYDGTCSCCGAIGPIWDDLCPQALELGTIIAEPRILPPLCDRCEYAQRRWDDAEYLRTHPSCGISYPYRDPPPKTPPVRG